MPTPTPASRLRILIVDDMVDHATVLSDAVASWGFSVRIAVNAAQAMRVSNEFEPRVVLLDLGLPDQHGYELARQLQKEAKDRKLFFVAVTGWMQIADQLLSNAAGIRHHLVKPVNHDLLREILNAYQSAEDAIGKS